MDLVWNDGLEVGHKTMDDDHRGLFELLARFAGAGDARYAALFGELERHLTEHFDRENELMQRTNFFAYHCHHGEHESVLAEVRSLLKQAQAGDLSGARAYIDTGVGPWFVNHRNTMDWVTAQYLKSASPCGCSGH